MSVQEIKKKFCDIIASNPDLNLYELRRIFTETLREWETEQGWDEGNKLSAWTDDELRVVISEAPTKENCVRFARAFKRGYGSIEQIYRWALAPDTTIKAKREDDKFIKQIKSIAKQLGWRA